MAEAQSTFQCTLTTPSGVVFSVSARRVTLPTAEGQITILNTHEPMIALARQGRAEIEVEGEKKVYAIEDGVIEVLHGGELLLLLEDATLEVE